MTSFETITGREGEPLQSSEAGSRGKLLMVESSGLSQPASELNQMELVNTDKDWERWLHFQDATADSM